MFNSPKKPSPDPKPLGVDPERMSTNESAIPLPWAAGKNRLALKWISPAYNQRTTAITQRVGKRNQTTGYNVYADIAAAICAGPVDALESIIIDGVVVWASANAVRNATHPHYYQATVPTYGTFRIYWGTSTQPKDDLILDYSAGETITWDDNEQPWEFPNRSGTATQSITYTTTPCPDNHPAYLDQCYIVWSQLFCGQNRESVPNVEVVVCKKPRPFAGIDPDLTDEGVNPVFAIAEILTNDLYGAGLPAAALDPVQWNNVATTAAALRTFARPTAPNSPVSVPFGHISPLVDRQATVKQVLNELFLYFDGYVRPRNGMLEIGHFPHDGVAPVGLTTLTLQDETALPEYQPGSWNDTISQATVVHRDYALQFKENAETCAQPLALAITGQPKRENLDRPFFITRWQAQDYAARWAQVHAHPQNLVRGKIRVRSERAVNPDASPLIAGDRFVFDYAPYSLQIVARVVSRQDDSTGGEVTIQFEAERGLAPLPYVTAGDTRPNVEQIVPTGVTNARIFQLPASYLGEPTPAVVPLVERPAAAVVGFNSFFSVAGSSYDLLGQSLAWAVRATTTADTALNAITLTVSASGLDIGLLQPQSAQAQDDNTLLVFIGSEILSVGAVTALGSGQYSLAVLRGRFGSTPFSHASGSVAYIIPRANLQVYRHANFPRTASVRYFKVQTYTVNDEQALASALGLTFTFADRGVANPTELTATAQNNAVFLSWKNPADLDLDFIQIYERDAASPTPDVNQAPTYTVYGNTFLRGGLNGGTEKFFWIRAVDTIGDKSTLLGPVNATAATPAPGANAKVLALTADSQQFKISTNGTATPSTINITATGQNLDGSPTFSVVAGTATLTGTGNSRALTYANTGTDFVAVRASWDGVEDTISITKVRDGINGVARNLRLTSTAQAFQIAKSGSVTPAAITFTAVGEGLAGNPVFTVPSGTATLTGTGTSRELTFANLTSDTASVAVTWDGLNDVISLAKLREGIDGAAAVVSFLTNEAHLVPANAAGTVSSFAGATSQMIVFRGGVDDTANWTFTKADTSATSSIAGNTVTVTALAADTGYVDITASRAGFSNQVKRFTVSKSKTGQQGDAGAPAKLVFLTGTAQTFQISKAGVNTPASITLTATGQNLTGSPTFTVSPANSATLTGTGSSRTLTYANMAADYTAVTVTWDGVSDTFSVIKVREGADGNAGQNAVVSVLTNEAHLVPADASGTVTSFAGAVTSMVIYNGQANDTNNWTFAKLDTNTSSSISGNTVTLSGLSADVGYIDIIATRSGFLAQTKRFTITKSRQGIQGSAAKLVAVTSSAQAFSIAKNGVVTPATITLTATGQNLQGSPTFTVAPNGAATLTGSGTTRDLTFANMAQDYASITVTWDGVSDTISLVKIREGTDGTPGQNAIASLLTNEAHLVPATVDGTVTSFEGASTSMLVYNGQTNDTANWTFTKADNNTVSSIAGNTVTVTALTADTGYIDITASRSGYQAQIKRFTVSKSRQGQTGTTGADAKLVVVTSTAQAFQINKQGANNPASITFTATAQNLQGTPTFTVAPANAATLTGSGATRELAFGDMSQDYAAVTVTWDGVSDTISVVKVREGTDGNAGQDAITALLTNETHNVSADAAGAVTSYAGASTQILVYKGITDDTANWTFSKADTSLTSSLAGNTVTVTALAADVGFVDITATRTGYASITKRFTVTKTRAGQDGNPGERGSKQFYAVGTAWTDAAADAAIAAAGLTKTLLDQVTISGDSFSQSRFWDGSGWALITQVIDGNLLVNGTIGANKLAVASLSAITANLGTVTAGSITANSSINVGAGIAQVEIDNTGLRIGGGRITMQGVNSAPAIRMTGASAFAGHAIEINGSTGAVPPSLSATGSSMFTSLTPYGFSTNGSYQISSGTFAGKIDTANTRFTLGTTSAHSVAIITGNVERVFIGADGHLKMNGGDIRNVSNDNWTPRFFDGTHTIRFRWDGGNIRIRVDDSDVGAVYLF